jgi:hypothetical protein
MKTAEMGSVEIWLVVDSAGDYATGASEDDALQAYADNIGSTLAMRAIKMTLAVALPTATEVAATIPSDADGEIQLAIG